MIPVLRDLIQHMVWADRELLKAVRAREGAYSDGEVRKWLHHIVVVQRFFFALVQNRQVDYEREKRELDSLDEMEQRYAESHRDALAFAERLTESDLPNTFEMPRMKEFRPSLKDILLQVAMHSEHHRAQAAARLRAVGGSPTVTDYILWVRTQRDAVTPANSQS
jgi:uncharacterized damage-inducible protein DinB